MTRHALLSASAAHRWLECTAAPRLELQFPDTTSDYAKEGTLAHAIAELKLRRYAIEPMSKATFTRRHTKLKKDNDLYQAEMESYTDEYVDRIKELMLHYKTKPYVVAEKRVDFSQFVPQGFGTADCLIMTGEDLHVIDFKYGKGVPVDAVGNSQLRLYALGALQEYSLLYGFKHIYMHIIQPRIGNYRDDLMKTDDLLAWGRDVVKPKADEAFGAKGVFKAGAWCKFCRAKGQCLARAEHYAELEPIAEDNHDPRLIDSQQLGTFLTVAKELEDWAKDLQEYALSACLDGKEVPGWKAVEGRGSRVFTDQEDAFEVLRENDIPDEVLYNRVPLTLAQTEKAVGKKQFQELVGSLVEKKPGKPTLVPASDKRPAISNTTKATDIFTPIKGE